MLLPPPYRAERTPCRWRSLRARRLGCSTTESLSRRSSRSCGYWVGMVRTLMARGWLAKPEDLLCKNHVNRNLRVRADTKAAYPNRRLPNADLYRFILPLTPPLGAAERNDPLEVSPYPLVRALHFRGASAAAPSAGPKTSTPRGVVRSCDPGLLLKAPSARAR